jgi:mannonate dehydratase
MCNVMLGVATWNFGVNEYSPFNANAQAIFKGCPVMKSGYLYPSELPGWGIEIDEQLAAKFPFGREQGERGRLNGGWGEIRRRDGTVIKQ